ncbi:MAG: MBL fold metallo-hydrolase [Deltaproteobacteria bacterium]|nr:MBL fold metallo-hydrolase [Candidatus Zymogenaceae bacterium]
MAKRIGLSAAFLLVLVPALVVSPAAYPQAADGNAFFSITLSVTNCFLLPCDGGYLLIDTSYPDQYEKFLKELARIGVDVSEIRYVLLTHHHDDHAGFIAEFVEKNPDVTVIVHEADLAWLAAGQNNEDAAPLNGCIRVLLGLFGAFHEFGFPGYIVRENDIILTGDDDELLHSIGIDGVILHTPGHTDDSVSVVMKGGDAFAGDVTMNFMKVCCIRHRPIFVNDMPQVRESWERLLEAGAVTIYPAHGKPFDADKLRGM